MDGREVEAGSALNGGLEGRASPLHGGGGTLGIQNPDPQSCSDKMKVECGPFGGSQRVHGFFFFNETLRFFK